MNFLEYAVWGAYLTSMGTYLAKAGLAEDIGIFYAMQGIVSLFMPGLIGIVADRWVPAQKLLGVCHGLAAVFMLGAAYYGSAAGDALNFGMLFPLYSLSVAFFMPTIALSNSVAYTVLEMKGFDRVSAFPPIRVFGTIGFICAMLVVNFAGYQDNYRQLMLSGIIGAVLALYAFTLPNCPVNRSVEKRSLVDMLGLNAFKLFKRRDMAVFFIFSMLLGVALQITNAYANPFITSFKDIPLYAGTFGANNANALISISQISETLGILLIPFFLKRYGIKNVMLMSMGAWVLRFGLFGLGNPGFPGVVLFILSMVVYGVAFDFFNISGSLYVDSRTNENIRSSAQGLFMIMTNGIGATVGTLAAQAVVNRFVYSQTTSEAVIQGWNTSWFIFAGYALVVGIVFALVFRYRHEPGKPEKIDV